MAFGHTKKIAAGIGATSLAMLGIGVGATSASADTATLTYDCTYTVLNIGEIGGNPEVTVTLEANLPAQVTAGETLPSADFNATVTIPDDRRDSLYGLLGVRAIDAPAGATNDAGVGNVAKLFVGETSHDVNLVIPKIPVPSSGDFPVPATGTTPEITLTEPGTYEVKAGNFTSFIKAYDVDGNYKTNITLDCTLTSEDALLGTIEVVPAEEPTEDPTTDEPTEDPTTEEPTPTETAADTTDATVVGPVVETDVPAKDANAPWLLTGAALALVGGAAAAGFGLRRQVAKH